jgi:indolepyruvate ferredoxin oxidoreductase
VSGESLYRALELYGRNVDENKRAFDWGRFAAESPASVERLARAKEGEKPIAATLDEALARRVEFLSAYQDAAYAERYRAGVARVAAAEQRVRPGSRALEEAVARHYFPVLAYKDEYEVARLHTETGFLESIKRNFGADARVSFNFSPPLFARRDPATGRPRKYELGPWLKPVLRLLAKLKWLRGTKFDPFRFSADRRLERELLTRYEASLDRIVAELDEARFEVALALAALPNQVRGFGPVKSAAAARARAAEQDLWEQWRAPAARPERRRASAA